VRGRARICGEVVSHTSQPRRTSVSVRLGGRSGILNRTYYLWINQPSESSGGFFSLKMRGSSHVKETEKVLNLSFDRENNEPVLVGNYPASLQLIKKKEAEDLTRWKTGPRY